MADILHSSEPRKGKKMASLRSISLAFMCLMINLCFCSARKALVDNLKPEEMQSRRELVSTMSVSVDDGEGGQLMPSDATARGIGLGGFGPYGCPSPVVGPNYPPPACVPGTPVTVPNYPPPSPICSPPPGTPIPGPNYPPSPGCAPPQGPLIPGIPGFGPNYTPPSPGCPPVHGPPPAYGPNYPPGCGYPVGGPGCGCEPITPAYGNCPPIYGIPTPGQGPTTTNPCCGDQTQLQLQGGADKEASPTKKDQSTKEAQGESLYQLAYVPNHEKQDAVPPSSLSHNHENKKSEPTSAFQPRPSHETQAGEPVPPDSSYELTEQIAESPAPASYTKEEPISQWFNEPIPPDSLYELTEQITDSPQPLSYTNDDLELHL